MRLVVRRLAVAGALVIVLLGLGGTPARAHAGLLSVDPSDGAVVASAPSEVRITFTEPVSLEGGSARVLDDTAAVVSGSARAIDATVVIPLEAGLDNGTYTVTWEVVSQDTHRVSGVSVFHVGAPSLTGSVIGATTTSDAGWGVRLGATLSTALAYAGALVAFGAWWTTVLILPRGAGHRILPGMIAARAAALGAAAAVASLPFRVARAGGGLGALRNDDVFVDLATGAIGRSTLVTGIGLVVAAIAVNAALTGVYRAAWRALVSACLSVGLIGFVFEGHTVSNRPRAVIVAADVVHLGAGGAWLGGLVALVVWMHSRRGDGDLAAVVGRFSTWALGWVLAVSAAGTVMAWIVLPDLRAIVDTGYGWALMVKVGLVGVVVALAAYNRLRLVPAIARGGASGRRVGRRLGWTAAAEVIVLCAVVVASAVLVARSPIGSGPLAAASANTSSPPMTMLLSNDAGSVRLVATPGRVGTNRLDLAIIDATGDSLDPVEPPEVDLRQSDLGIGPLQPVALLSPGPGRYELVADLGFPGDWDIEIRLRISDFESVVATGALTIDP